MSKQDQLDGLLRDSLIREQDWEFLQTAMNLPYVMHRIPLNKYIRHDCYGHSVANVFRSSRYEPDYIHIVRDTAKKMKLMVRDHDTVYELENEILAELIRRLREAVIKEKGQQEWDRVEREVEEELRRAAAEGRVPTEQAEFLKGVKPSMLFALLLSGKLSGIWIYLMVNKLFFALSRIFGWHIGVAVAGPIIGKTLSFLFGPVGWVFALGWLLWDLGNTNWRKTVPAVAAIAILRRQIELRRRGGDDLSTPVAA